MNNIEELICQSRIKEISHGSSPLIGEKERLALTAMYWHQEHQAAVEAFQETGRNLLLAQEQITALIAQLEAAQKERDEAIVLNKHLDLSIRKGEVVNSSLRERAEKAEAQAESNALEIRKLGLQWSRAEKVEAELSAANEKLVVPVVLPDDGLEDCINMWPDNWRNDFDTGYNFGIWRCEQNIKAAGFAVEGE
ncbi:Uncharacterised protein [Yersinia pseudotuberculosis]|uniref:Ead/Ea22-like family protein n=2 Tax=Yersinia pseudotuberculosis TaxID=633 RepID=A0A380Q9R4_YERPU|nr:Uncharacterised protein [Yersinia pseudotuberculosis]